MTNDERPGFERILDTMARRVSGAGLHPLELLQRVQARFEAEAAGGSAPNVVDVILNPIDYGRFEASLSQLRGEIAEVVRSSRQRMGLGDGARTMVSVLRGKAAPEGVPTIRFRFADTEHRPAEAVRGVTRRITRVRDMVMLVDGERVTITHTPFGIGRAPGNDLVIPSLTVSRYHAEIERAAEGFALHDLESRNGLIVEGQPRQTVAITDGLSVLVGETTLLFEFIRG